MDTKQVYSPYGYHLPNQGVLGFNGERPDAATGHYHLGNGYRAYNPALMRCMTPDSLSPFAQGGFSAYCYCQGDPVNFCDPSGHFLGKRIAHALNLVPTSAKAAMAGAMKVTPKKFTRLVAFHGTEAAFAESFKKSGVLAKFSQPGRQLQGVAFYGAIDKHQAKGYADMAHGPGKVFGIFLEDGLELVPGIGFTQDKAGRIAFKPPILQHLEVRELTPADKVVVELRRPEALKKKSAPAA